MFFLIIILKLFNNNPPNTTKCIKYTEIDGFYELYKRFRNDEGFRIESFKSNMRSLFSVLISGNSEPNLPKILKKENDGEFLLTREMVDFLSDYI